MIHFDDFTRGVAILIISSFALKHFAMRESELGC